MRAVWTLWSAPFRAHYHRLWYSPRHHLFSWVLSVIEAGRHYPETCLSTDSWGAHVLVDLLRLPFRRVDLHLDELDGPATDTGWWVLGKLTTYASQRTPFLHLDNDVFLWKPLPQKLTAAPLFAQNPEVFYFEDQSLYRLEPFMRGIERFGGWVPPEWRWYAGRRGSQALCCGILGGHDVRFVRHFANRAIEVIRHPDNQAVWPTLGVRDNILVEQYFLSACVHYRIDQRDQDRARPAVEYLFPSPTVAFDPEAAARLGYTHLIGDAKSNASISARLEDRVRREHPRLYERCLECAERYFSPPEAEMPA